MIVMTGVIVQNDPTIYNAVRQHGQMGHDEWEGAICSMRYGGFYHELYRLAS